MDYVANNGDVNQLTRKERFDLAQEFTGSIRRWLNAETTINQILQNIESFNSITNLLNTPPYSQNALNLIVELNNIIDYALDKAFEDTPLTPIQYNITIDSLINFIDSSYNIVYCPRSNTGNEYTMIVISCYISKASYKYWYEVATDTTHPWYDYLDDNSKTNIFRRIWRGIKVAAVDTYSFIIGPQWSMKDGVITFNIGEAVNNAAENSASV